MYTFGSDPFRFYWLNNLSANTYTFTFIIISQWRPKLSDRAKKKKLDNCKLRKREGTKMRQRAKLYPSLSKELVALKARCERLTSQRLPRKGSKMKSTGNRLPRKEVQRKQK